MPTHTHWLQTVNQKRIKYPHNSGFVKEDAYKSPYLLGWIVFYFSKMDSLYLKKIPGSQLVFLNEDSCDIIPSMHGTQDLFFYVNVPISVRYDIPSHLHVVFTVSKHKNESSVFLLTHFSEYTCRHKVWFM